MRSKTIFTLLIIFFSCCLLVSTQKVQKKKCPKVFGNELFVCPTEFKEYCVYFTGGECDSKLCARLTANECTACSDASSVSYYTESTCKASKVFCDSFARPENCSATESPVCGFYSSEDCPEGLCSQTARNPCEACGSQLVEYYKPGECSQPSQYTCNARNLFGQHENAGPVCAFFTEGCPLDICSRTIDSASDACEDSTVLYYKLGKCQNETSSCSTIDALGSACPRDYHPVCASLKECSGPDCSITTKTFDNACLACSAEGYEYFASGICEIDRRQCPSKDVVSDLPQDDNAPVCAFFDSGSQTYQNAFSACSQATPDYYVNGPCSFNCDEVWTGIMIPCIGFPVSPACGYYTEGCSNSNGICEESFTNSCYGCSTGKLAHFIDGLCPKNESIFCEPDMTPGSCAVIDPVCGVFEEDCNDSSCRQSFQNPCQVCEDPTIISYKPGLCPEDNGVPCDASNRPTVASCQDAITTGPVCGVTDMNCNDSSCRKTFDNTCLACADSLIIQFNNGECSA